MLCHPFRHTRSVLVAREPARLDSDIAALSEVRFAKQGSLTEDGADYIYSLLVWEEQGRAPPLWGRFHDENLHRQQTAQLTDRSL